MKYYLINEQDIYDLSVEIENCVLAIFDQKEIEEYPEEEEEDFVAEETTDSNEDTDY